MSAYLVEHLPHLTALHSTLGLPPTALDQDKIKIDAAIKAVVAGIVRERETEVENWKEAIEVARKDVICLEKALGNRSTGGAPETGSEPLPKQHERLLCQRKELEHGYRQRLAKVDELQEALTALANLLGAPFEPPKPLLPVAGPSNSRESTGSHRVSIAGIGAGPSAVASGSRKASGTSFKPETAEERKRSNVGVMAVDENKREVWLEVSDQVIEALEIDYRKATEERDNRRQQLISDFVDLRWLHSELGLPPIPLSHPHHFPPELLPDKSKEETPGAHHMYEKMLARFMATFEEDRDGEVEERGLEDMQPEVGLINWVEEVSRLWNEHKTACEARIQELFNQIEPHWVRMSVEQEFMDAFFDINRGSGEDAIAAYEAELERVLELRRASLSTFMEAVRVEIEGLWSELMMSEYEKDQFVGFIDDNYTEELLQAHEEYSELLRSEIESKAAILPKVREWHKLVEEEEELERLSSDPNRFKMRGGALLREEKLRKRVQVLKPRIEGELLKLLPEWEAEAKRPFMVSGERVVDVIQDALEAKEAAKEAKKRARQGLGPTKTVKATPAPATAARTTASSTIRKRAPEATPLPAGAKRQKVGGVPQSSLKPMTMPKYRPGQQSTMSTTTTTTRIVSRTRDGSSPTPIPNCALPRPAPASSAGGRAVSSGSIYMSKVPQPTSRISSAPVMSHAGLGKDATRRPPPPRRESFRPRQSVALSTLIAGHAEQWDLGELDEEMEVY